MSACCRIFRLDLPAVLLDDLLGQRHTDPGISILTRVETFKQMLQAFLADRSPVIPDNQLLSVKPDTDLSSCIADRIAQNIPDGFFKLDRKSVV